MRLALSEPAAVLLVPRRFRRFLSIELEDAGDVAARNDGPLSDRVAYVWIDLPDPGRIRIQTRVGRRAIATRTFALRDGLRADVAARLVAIAAAEMVRAQARPPKVRRPKPPRPPTPEQVELATRDNPAVLFTGGGAFGWIPSSRAALGGSSLELGFRMAKVRQRLAFNWLGGSSEHGPMQWLDLGVGIDRTWWSSAAWRFDLGAGVGAALLRMRDASSIGGTDGERDAWSSRATARLAMQRELSGPVWLGLSVEPGLILRSVPYEANGEAGEVEGFFLGLNLSLQLEHRLAFGANPAGSTSRSAGPAARH